jgi:hypothetical protein
MRLGSRNGWRIPGLPLHEIFCSSEDAAAIGFGRRLSAVKKTDSEAIARSDMFHNKSDFENELNASQFNLRLFSV